MGHTLVLNGVSVPNPVAHLQFADAKHLLADYYAENTSINDNEKEAIETLVDRLWEAGVWTKIRSFYPMLGNTVNDLLLDAKNVAAENYIKQNLSDRGATVTVPTRNFLNVSGGNNTGATELSRTDIRLYGLTHIVAYDFGNGSSVINSNNPSPQLSLKWSHPDNAYRWMRFELGTDGVPASATDAGNQSSYILRNVMYNYDGTTVTIYKDGEVWKSGSLQHDDYVCSRIRQVFYLIYNVSFFAQLDNLTTDELSAYSDAVATFIATLNKKRP